MSDKYFNNLSPLPDYPLGLFDGRDMPDVVTAWAMYSRCKDFNSSINLYDTVKVNENFFIGKQWEGVQSNGLPTPVFNFIKQTVLFIVASICTDSIRVNATSLPASPNTSSLIDPIRIINEELDSLIELNNVAALLRVLARNAAVDSDGAIFSYWDPDFNNGSEHDGAIRSEILDNTCVLFGDQNSADVQSQPFIIIEKHSFVRELRKQAKENGVDSWRDIVPDDYKEGMDVAKFCDDKATDLLLLWKNEETDSVWAFEFTHTSVIREPWDMELSLYPIVWLNWDYVKDSYHGQSMVTGLIHNQMFVNRSWALSMKSMMSNAYSKAIYDKTRIKTWDNRVGAAIPVQGGDINTVARYIDPAPISPQVSQYIQNAVSMTREMLGASDVALGNTRPDNTSAIIALQRAAATPNEITKQNLYSCVEDLCRIYIDFMIHYYGKRVVDFPTPPEVEEAFAFVSQADPNAEIPPEIPVEFDFSTLASIPYMLKLDVGASSYYSEIASMNTLDNLLRLGAIDIEDYLERVPDGYIPMRRELVQKLKDRREQMEQMQAQMAQGQNGAPSSLEASAPPRENEEPVSVDPTKDSIPTGGGYSALQRKVAAGIDVV